MYIYTPRTFNLPTLDGISADQVKVHLGLYEGYIKHVNLIAEKLASVRMGDLTLDPYMVNEIRRRFAFEFDGMRMHEYYFEQLEGGPTALSAEHAFARTVGEKYGSVDGFMSHLREVAGTRGIGWVVVYYDHMAQTVHTTFVADHEIGQLSGLPILLALDLWEHAFMVDYVPGEKKNYVEAFFKNMNWSVVEKRFEQTQK
jgi:superoxide dismutase, Fe-Mn family